MKPLYFDELKRFVNTHIIMFHESKLKSLQSLDLKSILKRKNPYLFKAKDLNRASDLVASILDAYLSSSEEKSFGDFLECLALFVAGKACGGKKSSANGIDLEFDNEGTHYLVSVKSGPSWGNSAQHREQETNFKNAVRILKQSSLTHNVMPVLGICYGKTKRSILRGYLKVVGQDFWCFISGNKNLYTDIIEPIGHKAKQHNRSFIKEKDRLINEMTREFLNDFCVEGLIDWKKFVQFNSGNLNIRK